MARDLDTVVELQEALRELRLAQARFASGPPALQELAVEHGGVAAELAKLEESVGEADKRRRSAESGIADAQAKLNHYQEQINRVSTQREYGALLREIDTVKSQIRELEENALGALEEIEGGTAQVESQRQGFVELDQRYRSELEQWEKERPEVGHRVEQLEGRIAVFRERLPAPVLALFERLFERHQGEPLAPVSEVESAANGPQMRHCGKCHYRIRPQVIVEIQVEGRLVPCDSCQRILFIASEAPR